MPKRARPPLPDMRLRFFEPTDERETALVLATERRIDAFWSEARSFIDRLPLGKGSLRAVEVALCEKLADVDRRLAVEIDEATGGGAEVFIVPRDDGPLEPLVERVISRAPRPGPAIRRHRSPRSFDNAIAETRRLFGVDLSSAEARAGLTRGHLLEVTLYSPSFTGARDDRALDAANHLVPRLVGEERFDDWVGAVEVAPLRRPGSLPVLSLPQDEAPRFALAELKSAMDRAVLAVGDTLAEWPYHLFCERAEWTMFELEPEPRADYGAQDDVALCVTMLPEMKKCFLESARFSSARFSKHGERFCYLKLDALGLAPEEKLRRRLELEDALNMALVPGRVGCVVGAALGLRYVYVDLALEHLEHGVELARRTARRLEASRRSWVLFFDTPWRAEWLGVWPDSPPPAGLVPLDGSSGRGFAGEKE